MTSAKIKANIIDINILGAAEGFLPKACTAEKPTAAMTAIAISRTTATTGEIPFLMAEKTLKGFLNVSKEIVFHQCFFTMRTRKRVRNRKRLIAPFFHNGGI